MPDLRRVPIETLPLQSILHFHPPPKGLAVGYLEAIASHEGLAEPTTLAEELYESCTFRGDGQLAQPLPPNGDEPLPHFDLRHAMMQMQLDRGLGRQTAHKGTASAVNGYVSDDLDAVARAMEAHSWADGHVSPRTWARIDVCEVDRHDSTPDDELGPRLLVKPDIHDLYPVIPAYDASVAMAEGLVDSALRCGSGTVDLPTLGDLQTAQ